MSDFIKVNFKSGHTCIMHKNGFHLHQAANKLFYANDANSYLAMLATLLSSSEEDRLDIFFGMNDAAEITREEYDRLCKELGVKIENNSLDCFHDYKLCDNRCAKCGILYNGIMDDMSFEEAKQIAINRVTDALERTGLVKELGVE